MNLKLKNNKIIDGDIKSPEMELATFSDDLCEDVKKHIVSRANHGDHMLRVYSTYRDNMHIVNIVDMLEKMEKIYHNYNDEVYQAKQP
jgi:hypothetical protein